MNEAHLSLETMARWLAGDLGPEEIRSQVVAHFLAKCSICRSRYEEISRLQEEFRHWDERVAVFEGAEALELFENLKRLSFDDQLDLVAEDSSFQTWALCQLLLKSSLDAAFEDPAVAVNWAELAVSIAQTLGDAYDPHWVTDLKARSYAYLGNAQRVLGELRSAEAAFRRADRLLKQSMTGNDSVEAEILHLKSSLRRGQRRFKEAMQLAEEALSIYREQLDNRGIGEVLVKKAKILEEMGNLEAAIESLQQAAETIDPQQDPRHLVYARYNLVLCLIAAGRYSEAEEQLPRAKSLFQGVAKPLDYVRLRWAEGRIASGLSRSAEAETAFLEVQSEFIRREMAYDAALVSLDVAVLYVQQHRTRELKKLAAGLLPVFESRDAHRETLATLVLFQRACDEEKVTLDLLQQLSDFFKSESRKSA